MVAAAYLIAFLLLIAWRMVFATLQREQLAHESSTLQRHGIRHWCRNDIYAIAEGCFDNGPQQVSTVEGTDRATTQLARIVALTGANQSGGTFILDIGPTRFYVRDRHVKRLRDVFDPTCEFEETCFYLPHHSMPAAEQIATALLALRNNPAVFDRWAAQVGAVKANGQVFRDNRMAGGRVNM